MDDLKGANKISAGPRQAWQLWQRLIGAKVLIAVLGLLLTAVFLHYLAGSFPVVVGTPTSWDFLKSLLPVLRDACLSTALIGAVYEMFVRGESEKKLTNIIADTVSKAIGSGALDLIGSAERLGDGYSRETVDGVIRAALQAKLGSATLGNEFYDASVARATSETRRQYKYRGSITLKEITSDHKWTFASEDFFLGIIEIRFTAALEQDAYQFRCVRNWDEYNASLAEEELEFRWVLPQISHLQALKIRPLEVVYFKVNDAPQIIETSDVGGQECVVCRVSPDLMARRRNSDVTIRYRVETLLRKHGNIASLSIVRPTRSVEMEFDVSHTQIMSMRVVDYFVSSTPPIISYLSGDERPEKVRLELDEWVFPRGGATFVWSFHAGPSRSAAALPVSKSGNDLAISARTQPALLLGVPTGPADSAEGESPLDSPPGNG